MQTIFKYYHNYDFVYKKLKKQKHFDNIETSESLKTFLTNDVLSRLETREKYKFLEIGCGQRSLFEDISLKGKDVSIDAVDISETAIEIAKALSKKEQISYFLQDACNMEFNSKFDLIVDAHCLHCLTDDVDRALYLNNVALALKKDGLFALECMISHEDLNFDSNYFYDSDNVLFKLIDDENFQALSSFEGQTYMPIRKIPSAFSIENELLGAGLKIIYFMAFSNLKMPVDPYVSEENLDLNPEVLRVICSRI